MCNSNATHPDRPIRIQGIPFSVSRCSRHVHGIGQAPMPDGGAMTLFATEPTREALVLRLADLVRDLLGFSELQTDLLSAAYLVFGISIVDPGSPIEALAEDEEREIESLVIRSLSGDVESLVLTANRAVLGMDPALPMTDRKRAEAHYTALVKAGLRHMLQVPSIQREANGVSRD